MQTTLGIALNPNEMNAVFPDGLRAELCGITPRVAIYEGGDSDAWERFLCEQHPDILVSAWKTPRIPDSPASDSLRYVCHVMGSVRNLVPRSLLERGLRVTNWGNNVAEAVAESIMMLTLSSLRQTQYWGRKIHEHKGWRTGYGEGRTLFGRKVAIHGFGRIARALLNLLKPWNVQVLVYSAGVPQEYIRQHGAEPVESLDALFSSGCDVLVEVEALTPKSRCSVRESHLRSLKPQAVFVNSGRGAVVDEEALARVAAEGAIWVALDVYTSEPLPPDSPFRGLPNATLMPHVGGPTRDRFPALGHFALSNLRRWMAGESLDAEITLPIYDAST